MPDDRSPAAKRMHLERLVARGGGLTLEESRQLVGRVVDMHSVGPLHSVRVSLWLSGALVGAALGFVAALLVR